MLPDGFSEGKINPFFVCLLLGAGSSLRFRPACLHAFAARCPVLLWGTRWSPQTTALARCFFCLPCRAEGVLKLSRFIQPPVFSSCCDPSNGPRHRNPLSSGHPARGLPARGCVQHRAGDGQWQEGTDPSWLFSWMVPAQGLWR